MGEITDPYEQKGSGIVDPYAKPAEPDMGGAAAFGEGAKQGATFGLSDELAGASAAAPKGALDYTPRRLQGIAKPILGAARLGINAVTGNDPEAELTYNMERDAARKRDELAAKQHPIAHGVGEVAGALPTMAVLPEAQMARAPALLRPTLKGAQVGAEYGAASGFGQGEGLGGSLAGAGIGTGVGAVGGAGAGAASQVLSSVVGGTVGKVIGAYNGWKDPEGEGARRLGAALLRDQEMIAAGDAKGMTAPQWLAAKRAGEPVTLADLGSGYTQEMLRSAANTSPEAWARLEKVLDERFRGQGERVAQDVRSLVAGGANAGKSADQLVAEYDLARAPAYKQAYEQGDKEITSPVIERLMGSPRFVTAMKNAVSSGQDRAVTQGLGAFNPGVTVENGIIKFTRTNPNGVPQYPNLQYWDAVKKELDSQASVAARAGDKGAAEVAGNQAKLLREQLDKQVPSYANARGVAEQFFGERNALEAGAKMNKRNTDPREIQRAMSKMKDDEKELFREGYASDWAERLIGNMSERRDITKAMFTSPNERARALAVFGESGLAKIETRLALETVMQGAKNAMGNSTTMKQLFAAGLAGGIGGGVGGYQTSWTPTGIGMGAVSAAGVTKLGHEVIANGLQKLLGKVDSRASAYISELLTSNDLTQMQKGIDLATKNKRFADALRQIANYTFVGSQNPGSTAVTGQVRSMLPVSKSLTAGQEDQKPAIAGFASGGIVADRKADGAIRMLRAMRAKPKPRLKKKERASGGQADPYRLDPLDIKAADFAPREPHGSDLLGPRVSVDTPYASGPSRVRGEVSVPFAGGNVGISGNYSRWDDRSPPSAGAMLNYRRQFASGGSVKGALRDATDSFAKGGMPGGDTTDFYSGEVLPADDWADREAKANLAAQGEPARGWGDTWQGIKDFPSRLAQHDPNAPPSETFPILDKSNIVNAVGNLVRGGVESFGSGVTTPGDVSAGKVPMWDEEGHTSPQLVGRTFDLASIPAGGTLATGAADAAAGAGRNVRVFGKQLMSDTGEAAPIAAAEHAQPAPRFYSHLEKTVEDLPFKTGTADQLLGTLKNKGVKDAELEATGTADYLASKGGEKVTKDELLQHIAQNKVELGQVVKGEHPPWDQLTPRQQQLIGEHWQHPDPAGLYESLRRDDPEAINVGAGTKFQQYQLPGGENYKEKLLTLPEGKPTAADIIRRDGSLNVNNKGEAAPVFTSSHWDEPNVLVHTRSNERNVTGVNGGANDTVASHHIEEIQSDWHQKGRKQGYGDNLVKDGWRLVELENGDFSLYDPTNHQYPLATGSRQAVLGAAKRYGGLKEGVPDAPFKSNWHELAIKDALADAVAAGKTRISWTPGEAQAARYDLSKHVDKLSYDPTNGQLRGWKNGEVTIRQTVEPDKLADHVGKDVAQKLIEQPLKPDPAFKGATAAPVHSLEGQDLSVGGAGMKGFYDKMVPQVLNKIGKPHGVKVEKGTTAGRPGYVEAGPLEPRYREPETHPVHYMDIPPSLADQIRTKGFSLFEDSSAGAPIAALEHSQPLTYDSALSKTKHLIPVEHMTATHKPTGELLPREVISPEKLQGSILTPAVGDRTAAGAKLTHINENKLSSPVRLQGGPDFMRSAAQTKDSAVWASGKGVISTIARRAREIAETGKDANFVYSAASARNGDYSTMMSEALLAQMESAKIPRKAVAEFDASMKHQNPAWPGLKSKALHDKLMASGPLRKQFVEEAALATYQERGFPDIGSTRAAITERSLLGQPTGASGYAISKLDPSGKVIASPRVPHKTYSTQLGGSYVGGLEKSVPRQVMFPDFYKARRAANAPVLADDRAFGMSDVYQPATQEWLDRIMKQLGYRRGGAVRKKLMTSSALQTAYAMKRQG